MLSEDLKKFMTNQLGKRRSSPNTGSMKTPISSKVKLKPLCDDTYEKNAILISSRPKITY